MRLYLEADSKNHIGYTPDWIRFKVNDNLEITYDVQGCIDYDNKTLSCRAKGELVPWVVLNPKTDVELAIDALDVPIGDILLPLEQLMHKIDLTQMVTVGVVCNSEEPVHDTISVGQATLEIGTHSFSFSFESEIMDY